MVVYVNEKGIKYKLCYVSLCIIDANMLNFLKPVSINWNSCTDFECNPPND